MRFSFLASSTLKAQETVAQLKDHYEHADPTECDVLIAVGGDGFMLETLHTYQHLNLPVYGLNCGTIGFLMNQYHPTVCLKEQVRQAHQTLIYPLLMTAYDTSGQKFFKYAVNEVSLFRESSQASKLKVVVDGIVRLEDYTGDGLMVATPAGSTAYNFSVHGPIIPLGANLLALTPISPFRPRRWRGALLPDTATITLEVLEGGKRPVSAAADHSQVRSIACVQIVQDRTRPYKLLFDPHHNFEARILKEQFLQ